MAENKAIMTHVGDIIPYAKNAKQHPAKQIEQIANSIKEFGFNQPIVVDRNNVIIVGHGRYEAALQLGMTEVPVVTVDLSEEKAKAYRLADNKLNESEWDMALVIDELKSLPEELFDLTGFDKDLIIEDDEKDDEVPELPVAAKAKVGEIYQLGPHRVMCGDATNPDHVEKLMNGHKADMVFTDPPYNINYKGQGKNTSNTILADNMDGDDFQLFLNKTFANYGSYSKSGAGLYVFHSSITQASFEKALEANALEIKFQLIWNKPAAGLGMGDYRWKHEPFFYACHKGYQAQFYGDRTHTTVWDFQKSEQQLLNWAKKMKKWESEGQTTIWTVKREPVHGYVHPTQKPVELICYALTNSSKAEDLILDLFLGSGSTLIAAEKTNRVCYGMELDPKYVDVIIQRWEEYTGRKAELVV